MLSTNAAAEIILPAMHTARQPYLFANADTTGPIFILVFNETTLNLVFSHKNIIKLFEIYIKYESFETVDCFKAILLKKRIIFNRNEKFE